MQFNDKINPKAKTELFKLYTDVSESGLAPEYELQGRGVGSWTISTNSGVTKTTDVLGKVDFEREPSQPTQTGVEIKLRKGSKLAQILFEAWAKNENSKIDAMTFLQKFEFIDGKDPSTCFARKESEVMIGINDFTGEAGGYLGFNCDFHYSNNTVYGTMPKVDGDSITFAEETSTDSGTEATE